MPSASLLQWKNDRLLRLQQVDNQCAASLAGLPPNALLVDENLRAYVLALSAHFQGFCRDLCTEAAIVIASKARQSLRYLIQEQFTAHRKLDRGNPTYENLKEDYKRFGFTLDFTVNPANGPRLADLASMNKWRNVAAHQDGILPTIPLNLGSLRNWQLSCNGLAVSLDDIVYNHLRKFLRRTPW